MRYAVALMLLVGCAAPRVAVRPVSTNVQLTWTAVGFGMNVAHCLEAYSAVEPVARARWCNCFVPELMRASPDPVGRILQAEIDAATGACADARPSESDLVEDSIPAPQGVEL